MKAVFELATPADDAAIRRLLACSPVPGAVALTYEREPDYFLGCGTMGHFYQVPIARHPDEGTLIGLSCRAVRPMFINGQVEAVGYLGQLRIAERFRGRWLLSHAFRYLRELHADGRAAGYITTIIEDNQVAQGVLVEHAPRHFPHYREVARLCTLALLVSRSRLLHALPARLPPGCTLQRGTPDSLGEIVAFLQQQGASKQFFPFYTAKDFLHSPLTAGFRVEDFVLARRRGQIVGVVGLWDQSDYKQTVVQSYQGRLRRCRPLYNVGAWLAAAPPLPRPGEHLRYAYASFICIQQNNPQIFRALLWQVYRLAAMRGYSFLSIGLTASDPLLSEAQRYAHIPYYSRLYTVCWREEAGAALHTRLDGRIPYVEIAAL
jgi:hypothetical protein